MSNYSDYRRDDKRYSDNTRGRRESGGGGYGGPSQQVCFYCKEPGHRISDCPKKSKQNNQRGGGLGFKNNRNNNGRDNKNIFGKIQKEKDNFVYEDNCPPPEDEDWGGGEDSEEERKKKKKEDKKLKKLQDQENQQLEDQNNERTQEQEWQNYENEERLVKQRDYEREEFNQRKDQTLEKVDTPDAEDWGGGGDDENPNQQQNIQPSFELSLEDQIKAQFSVNLTVHSSRVIEEQDKTNIEQENKHRSRERLGDSSREKFNKSSRERERNREQSRERNRDSSRDNRDRYDNNYNRQRSSEYNHSRKDGDYNDNRDRKGDYRGNRRDYDKYNRDSDRKSNKYNGNSERDRPLRDTQLRQQEYRKSQDRFDKFASEHKDEITDKINEMLMAKAFGGPQIDLSVINQIAEEENPKKDEKYEEWTLEDLQQDDKQNGNNIDNNGNWLSKTNNYNKMNDDEDWGGNDEGNTKFKQEYNSPYQKNSYHNNNNNNFNNKNSNNYNNNNNNRYKNNSNKNYNNDRYNNNNFKQKQQEPILVISDDEDPWASPEKRNQSVSNYKSTSISTASSYKQQPASIKQKLDILVNNNLNNQISILSPVYEPNKDSDDEKKSKKQSEKPLLFNPDEQKYEALAIENFEAFKDINNFNEEQTDNQSGKYSESIKLYDEIPETSYQLGYDRYYEKFKDKIFNALYPQPDGNCLKVYEGDIKMKRYTDKGQLSVTIKGQVYTNHPWEAVKWIPSLRILKSKDRVREFQTIDYLTAASQLCQMHQKEKYDRLFYLFWIEGLNQEDEDKLEEYSSYLYTKKLLSGVNLDAGCFTMAHINQLFPMVQSYTRANEFNKKNPIKTVLIYNPENGYQVTYKSVQF